MKIHIIYFSATYTTRTVCRELARNLSDDIIEHDITNSCPGEVVNIPSDELLVVGTPVYCGRVPEMESERLKMFRGNNTKAITVAVFGNREFDDALLELTNIVHEQGFRTIASAAFIGRHCIFPNVATERPDASDKDKIKKFADSCRPMMTQDTDSFAEIRLPGNDEYCPHKKVPFYPVPTEGCTNCGTCARLCPAGAISLSDVSEVNPQLCLACGRCIVVCPEDARHFIGDMYKGAAAGFEKANGARKEPVFFFAENK